MMSADLPVKLFTFSDLSILNNIHFEIFLIGTEV